MLQYPQALPLSSVDTGADTLGSGFHLWKRRTDHVKRFQADVRGVVALIVGMTILATILLYIFGA